MKNFIYVTLMIQNKETKEDSVIMTRLNVDNIVHFYPIESGTIVVTTKGNIAIKESFGTINGLIDGPKNESL